MKEQLQPRNEQEAGPGGFGGPFDNDESNAAVTVTSGIYAEQLPVGNSSVGEIRTRFRDRLDIDPQSVAILDGRDVDDQTTVRAGQVLMFVRRAGEKGLSVRQSPSLLAGCEQFLRPTPQGPEGVERGTRPGTRKPTARRGGSQRETRSGPFGTHPSGCPGPIAHPSFRNSGAP